MLSYFPFLSLLPSALSLALPNPQSGIQETTPGFSGSGIIALLTLTDLPIGCMDASFQFLPNVSTPGIAGSVFPDNCAVFTAAPESEVDTEFDETWYGVGLNSTAGCCDVGTTQNSTDAARCGAVDAVCGYEFATDGDSIQPLFKYPRIGGDPSRDGEEWWTLLDVDQKTIQYQYGDGDERKLQWIAQS